MRPDRVVLPAPHLDQYLHLLERVKDLSVQKFITELPVEALGVSVLPTDSATVLPLATETSTCLILFRICSGECPLLGMSSPSGNIQPLIY